MAINKLVINSSTTNEMFDTVNGLVDSVSVSYMESAPTGFNWPALLPEVKAIRSGDYFTANLRPENLIDFSQFTNFQYVDISRPDSSGDGLSWATAKKSIGAAVDVAISTSLPTRIFVKGGVYPRGSSFCNGNATKMLTSAITIESAYGRVETGTFDDLTWAKTTGQDFVYEASRSNANQVINPKVLDEHGNCITLKKVASLALCNSTPNSFYTDNVAMYVHHINSGVVSNENTRVLLNAVGCSISGNHDFYISNVFFQGGNSGALRVRGGSTNVVVADSCKFNYAVNGAAVSPTEIDGVVILGCKLFAAFDSESSSNSKDGFNLHIEGAVEPSMLTVRCSAFKNGQVVGGSLSCNGITIHDGLKAIDIGSTWLGSVGTNAGHVNDGTQVWHFGSKAGVSGGDVYNGGTLSTGAFGAWDGAVEMWLDSCTDVGSRFGVSAYGTANAYIRRHSGVGVKDGNVTTY